MLLSYLKGIKSDVLLYCNNSLYIYITEECFKTEKLLSKVLRRTILKLISSS